MFEAIVRKKTSDGYTWLDLCAQIMEALQYLHEEAGIIHNDITSSNILVTDSMTQGLESSIQIVLIDFGKATTVNDGRKYQLSDVEKAEYTR
jgi:serine/threonine protein kinase